MKKIFSILAVSLLILSGCEKEIDGPYLQYGANPVLFTPSANTSFVLKEEKPKMLTNITGRTPDTDTGPGDL
jgi:PBP1b-binding outer membrane lipoprotein LpoB